MRYHGKRNKHNKVYAIIHDSELYPDLINLDRVSTYIYLSDARQAAKDYNKYRWVIVCYHFFPDSGDLDYYKYIAII